MDWEEAGHGWGARATEWAYLVEPGRSQTGVVIEPVSQTGGIWGQRQRALLPTGGPPPLRHPSTERVLAIDAVAGEVSVVVVAMGAPDVGATSVQALAAFHEESAAAAVVPESG